MHHIYLAIIASVSKKKDGTTKPKKPKWLHGELSQQEANGNGTTILVC